MELENNYKIYSLNDPKSGFVRYVGLTKMSLEKRLRFHLCQLKVRCHKNYWIKKLKSHNLKPSIRLLENSLTKEQASLKEILYIRMFKNLGYSLVNNTNGGDGISGYRHTEETKKKIAKAGIGRVIKHSEECKKQMSLTRKGRTPWNKGLKNCYTEETLRKFSSWQKGRYIGSANPFYGKKHTPESLKKMSDSQRRRRDR